MAYDDPPKEFRIFRRGWNHTTKGDALFDDKAAQMVMAEYKLHGVKRQIDLEHLSLDRESPNYDPDSRGSFELEVRNGELWAVSVAWAPDGERRLREKKQRYISPFFFLGSKTRRITSLYNCAICGTPATFNAPELVAAIAASKGAKYASLSIGVGAMDFKKMIVEMLGLEGDPSDEEVLQALKTALDEEPAVDTADDPKDKPKDKDKIDAADDDEPEEKELSALPPLVQARIRAKLGKADALSKRLEALEQKTSTNEVETLLAANADKFSLKQEKWLKTQKPEVVREFLAHADPVARPAKAPPVTKAEDIESMQATDADRQIARATGEKLETILEGRKQAAKKRALKLA